MIKAKVKSDDGRVVRHFDATRYFEQASDDEIRELAGCDWGGDMPADNVALFMADHDDTINDVFSYLELVPTMPCGKETQGFECYINEPAAVRWLKDNRTHVYQYLVNEEKVYPEDYQD